MDFSKGPRSNYPLQEGWLDHAKGPRSNPPPSERVGWTFQTVQGPWGGGPYTRGGERRYKVTLVYYTGGGIMVYYIGVYRYIGGKQYFM